MVNSLRNRQIVSHSSCTICIFLDTLFPQLKTNSYSLKFPMFWYSSVSVTILHLCLPRDSRRHLQWKTYMEFQNLLFPPRKPSWELPTPSKKENCQPLLPLTYMEGQKLPFQISLWSEVSMYPTGKDGNRIWGTSIDSCHPGGPHSLRSRSLSSWASANFQWVDGNLEACGSGSVSGRMDVLTLLSVIYLGTRLVLCRWLSWVPTKIRNRNLGTSRWFGRWSQEGLVGDIATEDSWGSASEDPLEDSVDPLMGEKTVVFIPQISSCIGWGSVLVCKLLAFLACSHGGWALTGGQRTS